MCQNQTQAHPEMTFTATCTDNEVWEPDPRDYCTIIDHESDSKGTSSLKNNIHTKLSSWTPLIQSLFYIHPEQIH